HSLTIIEDAAQAHGAAHGGRRAGSTGLGGFSFYATKNVTSGEGGVITPNDDAYADALRVLRNQGMRRRYEHVMIGENLRMTEVAAAIAIPQMERLDEINAARRRNAERLTALLAGEERLTLPCAPPSHRHAWHQYTVLLATDVDRDAVVAHMDDAGIECGVYYPRLVWDHEAYRRNTSVVTAPAPVAEAAARRCLSLPVHPGLDDGDIDRIARELRGALR
ncbi:MAG: DegT/DnrJ/EryC1/StrS aminotransferase family protein, partial [Candidatus Dormibacteraeota bacterium]|nr:DegT/DnrJ/EryC1/StrS aminotransferase family protein [Candidatus Dormibacteraeota bacterium]